MPFIPWQGILDPLDGTYPSKSTFSSRGVYFVSSSSQSHTLVHIYHIFHLYFSIISQHASFINSTWSLHLVQVSLYFNLYILFILHHCLVCMFNLCISSVIFHIMHSHFIPSVEAYFMLHPFIMQVQVLSIQITHRSVLINILAASVVSCHTPMTIEMFLNLVIFSVSVFLELEGGMSIELQLVEAFHIQYQIQHQFLSDYSISLKS